MDDLTLYFLHATQAAATAAHEWVGRGDPSAADAAAVAAMRDALADVPALGTVVIGEGIKDDAPMLYDGEVVGRADADGRGFDLAVDPLENTKACARGDDGAITVLGAAPSGTLLSTPAWYMDKIVVGPDAVGSVDIGAPVEHNVQAVSRALGRPVADLCVVVLDKPRHEALVDDLRRIGVKVSLIRDGDVLGALRVLLPEGGADMLMGIGGAPEGVLTACAVRVLGGDMVAALAPQKDRERELIAEAGQALDETFTLETLVRSPDCAFAATGVTSSELLHAPRETAGGDLLTCSIVATPLHPALVVDTRATPAPQRKGGADRA